MAMKDGAGTPLNPANLWGKPDPRAGSNKEQKMSRRTDDEEQFEDEDVDLDAELDAAEEDGALDEDTDAEDAELAAEEDDSDFDPEEGDTTDETEDEEYDVEEEVVAEAKDADAELEDDETEQAESADDAAEIDDDTYATDEVDTAPVATNRKRDMAEKKKITLSDHIRAEIKRRRDSGASLRGKDILEALARRDITVSAAQISQIMKKEGVPPGKPGRRKAAVEAVEGRSRDAGQRKRQQTPAPKPAAKAPERAAGKLPRATETSRGFSLPMQQLKAVEAFVEACGGFQNAERILTAAASLSNQFSAFDN